MAHSLPSALITDQGKCVRLRLRGLFYELSQEALRAALRVPNGPPGLGISIDGNRLRFEFFGDNRIAEATADDLQRRIAKQLAARA
jgi:hypothetical protein